MDQDSDWSDEAVPEREQKPNKDATTPVEVANDKTQFDELFGSGSDTDDDRVSAVGSDDNADKQPRESVLASYARSSDSDDDAMLDDQLTQQEAAPLKKQRVDLDIKLPRIPSLHEQSDTRLLCKVPNFLHIEHRPFDPATFQHEVDGDEKAYEETGTVKLRVENALRWRFHPDSQDRSRTAPMQTNVRMLKWSDGTESLAVGGEIFDIAYKSLLDEKQYLVMETASGTEWVCQGKLDQGISLRPATLKSITHKKLTATMLNAHAKKVNRIKMVHRLHNPEQAKKEAEKLEAELIRVQRKAEMQQRTGGQGRRKGYTSQTLNERSLEQEEFSDDDFDDEFRAAASRQHKKSAKTASKSSRNNADMDLDDEGELSDFVVDDDVVEEATDEELEEEELSEDDEDLEPEDGEVTSKKLSIAVNGTGADDSRRSTNSKRVVMSDDEEED